jgi:hypothetical protein
MWDMLSITLRTFGACCALFLFTDTCFADGHGGPAVPQDCLAEPCDCAGAQTGWCPNQTNLTCNGCQCNIAGCSS